VRLILGEGNAQDLTPKSREEVVPERARLASAARDIARFTSAAGDLVEDLQCYKGVCTLMIGGSLVAKGVTHSEVLAARSAFLMEKNGGRAVSAVGAGARKEAKLADDVAQDGLVAEKTAAKTEGKAVSRLECPCCFAAGTTVLTSAGPKAIEDIRVGDLVMSRQEGSGVAALKPVTALIETNDKEAYELVVRLADGTSETFIVTDNHPFWVLERSLPERGAGWVDSAQLRPGMKVLTHGGLEARVTSLNATGRVQPAYNFSVADFHTYFVGRAEVLVHNECPCKVGTGEYRTVGGHHAHQQAAFKDHASYDPRKGFSISQEYMRENGINHQLMTNKQRELFKELAASGRPNSLQEHSRIAVEALKAGGVDEKVARSLVADSLRNLREQGVRAPSNVPWKRK
jgi:hypothetical protein